MKRIYTILVAVLLTASVFAQTPEKMSYQAVIRNSSDQLVTNQGIGMQISILQTTATGTAVYVETHNTTTNANGLVTVEIGNGTVVSGDFATIDWATDVYFIQTETDPTGGTTYTITGTTQLMSVPYALHAKTAESITGTVNYTETDPVYTVSQASNITGTDITNLGNLTGTNTGDQDITGIAINEQAIQDTASQIRADIPDVSGFVSTETDPVYTVSQASNITGTDITNLSNLSGVNTGDQDGSETKVTAGTNVTVTGAGTTASPYVVNAVSGGGATLAIGDSYQGGIIFWLDATGQHGLIATAVDQSTSMRWYAGTYGTTRATGDGLFSGELNTSIIISSQVSIGDDGSDYAAQICNDLQITEGGKIYGDWYLPSKYELNLLYIQKTAVGGFASAYYWSSTEYSNYYAWNQSFVNGSQVYNDKYYTYYVRAIRAF